MGSTRAKRVGGKVVRVPTTCARPYCECGLQLGPPPPPAACTLLPCAPRARSFADCGRRVLFLGLPTLSLPPRPRLTGPDGHAEAQAEAVASRAVERGHVVTTIDPRAFGDGFFLQLMYTATLRHIFTF